MALVAPRELARLLDGPDPPILVDVRSAAERSLAHLGSDVALPLAELPRRHLELPAGRSVVTYCQFGSDARRAAEFLAEHGHPRVAALEGGIDEYARTVDPGVPRYRREAADRGLVLQQFPRPDSGCLAYLLGDPFTRSAIIVDPGREVDPYLAQLRAGGWDLVAIVETHTHADHLAGHAALHARTDAPIYVGRRSPAQYPHRTLADGESLAFGGEAILAIDTPGHTADHVTLRVRDKVFTGDTLLLGACGRTDLGDGNPATLWESLTERILPLPDETEVFPAHFGRRHALVERYASTIGFERATNEALRQGTREAFLVYMTEGWPAKPADFDRIVRTNLTE
ncbi:MAG: MBL fold metallo-hydrolase [Thermoplasmata archaeon]